MAIVLQDGIKLKGNWFMGLGLVSKDHSAWLMCLQRGTIYPCLLKRTKSRSELVILRTVIKFELFSVLFLPSKWMKPNEVW